MGSAPDPSSSNATRAIRDGASGANSASYSRSAQCAAPSACCSSARMEGTSSGVAGRISKASVFRRCEDLGIGAANVVNVNGRGIGVLSGNQFTNSDAANSVGLNGWDELHVDVGCLQPFRDF